jgi:hypothetical protein
MQRQQRPNTFGVLTGLYIAVRGSVVPKGLRVRVRRCVYILNDLRCHLESRALCMILMKEINLVKLHFQSQ